MFWAECTRMYPLRDVRLAQRLSMVDKMAFALKQSPVSCGLDLKVLQIPFRDSLFPSLWSLPCSCQNLGPLVELELPMHWTLVFPSLPLWISLCPWVAHVELTLEGQHTVERLPWTWLWLVLLKQQAQ